MADVTKPHLRKMFEVKDLGSGNFVEDFFPREKRVSTESIARQGVEKNRGKEDGK